MYATACRTNNARRFSIILTQRAISDVWLGNGDLIYPDPYHATENDYAYLKGTATKVYQMHKHNPNLVSVRTLEALRCAMNRLKGLPKKKIVLATHDKQYWRSYYDLASIHGKKDIINPNIRGVPHPQSQSAFHWMMREFYIAKPIEWFQRKFFKPKYRPEIILETIDD